MTALADGRETVRLRRESPAAKLANVDWSLLLFTLAIVPIGIIAIFSVTRGPGNDLGFAVKQSLFFAIGLTLSAIMAAVDYSRLRQYLGLMYGVTAAALILVLIFGRRVSGTKGWFVIGGISVQPAEFAKLALIIGLAAVFTGRAGNVEAHRLITALAVLGAICVLVLLESETGSVLVYLFIALGIFFVAGVPGRLIFLLVVSAAIALSLILSSGVLKTYQQERLTAFIDDSADPRGYGWNQRQSVTAVGSGGITGAGLFEGPQTQFGFVPEQETDFIFTAIAEELGFVGATAVLALEALILLRVFRAAKLARDGFGTLLCIGVFSMLLIQVFQNVGMTLRLMPITGIPLPFLSYGGSSLVTSLLALGIVQSVAVHRYRGDLL